MRRLLSSPAHSVSQSLHLSAVGFYPVQVLTLLVRWHSRLRPVVRVVGGFSGFTLAVAAVPLVRTAPSYQPPLLACSARRHNRSLPGLAVGTTRMERPAKQSLHVAMRRSLCWLLFQPCATACPQLDMAGPGDAAFRLTLALVALCGVCDGLAQGALFGDAAALPPRFTQVRLGAAGCKLAGS